MPHLGEREEGKAYATTGSCQLSVLKYCQRVYACQPSGEPATIQWLTVGGRTSAFVAELQHPETIAITEVNVEEKSPFLDTEKVGAVHHVKEFVLRF
jgi:hypothetical protein